jgi:hypothetical protein
LKGQPDPKTGADFLRESPWEPNDVSTPRKRWMVNKFLELAGKLNIAFDILISIDDSLGKKRQSHQAFGRGRHSTQSQRK